MEFFLTFIFSRKGVKGLNFKSCRIEISLKCKGAFVCKNSAIFFSFFFLLKQCEELLHYIAFCIALHCYVKLEANDIFNN